MSNFGSIPSGLTLGASQAARRNSGNTAFEAFTATADGILPSQTSNSGKFLTTNGSVSSWATVPTGITIGSTAITGGTNNRLLFQASGVVSQSGNLTFDGSTLAVEGEVKITNGTKYCGTIINSSYQVVAGHAAHSYTGDNIALFEFRYYAAGYGNSGLKLSDTGNGYSTVIQQIASGKIYITDAAGSPGSLSLGIRENPGDGSTFTASSGRWIINSGGFVVNNSAWNGLGQTESYSTGLPQFVALYDASNYFKTTVGSSGAVEFDAVGSGAKFTFKDDLELSDAKNLILGTSTGTKIGTSSSQKIGFFGVTPVTQRTDTGSLTDSTGGSTVTTLQDVDGGGGVADIATINDNFAGTAAKINAIRTVLRSYGLMS